MKLACTLMMLAAGCADTSSFELTATPPHPMQPKRLSDVTVVTAPAHAPGVLVARLKAQSLPHYPLESRSSWTLAMLRQIAANKGCDAIEVDPAGTMLAGDGMRRTVQRARCFVTP